jgi:deoxycytidylate deaminase
MGYKSGERLDICPATHAEANCVANAARHGTLTMGATLYLNWVHPCKDCTSLLINAGISEIVCIEGLYDQLSQQIAHQAQMKVRNYV